MSNYQILRADLEDNRLHDVYPKVEIGVSFDQSAEALHSELSQPLVYVAVRPDFAKSLQHLEVFFEALKHGLLLASELFNFF